MARNKYPELTFNRILDAAYKLFIEKGYEQTTIQDIVDELGDLSKGAIYHHFKSKDDIIDVLTSRIFSKNNPLESIKSADHLNGLNKIKESFVQSVTYNAQFPLFYKAALSLLNNPKFLAQSIRESVEITAPYLETLIEEGNNDGSLTVAYPKQTAEACTILLNVWLNPAVFRVSEVEFRYKLEFLKTALEGMGLPVITDSLKKQLLNTYSLVSD